MPDSSPARPRAPNAPSWPLALLGGIGVILALATGIGGVVAVLAGIIAQPLLALAARCWCRQQRADIAMVRREGLWLFALWATAMVGLAGLLAWPVSALLGNASLLATLALCLVGGLGLIGLWRLWPLWQCQERDGGWLPEHWWTLPTLELGAWRGLGVAVAIAALAWTMLLLAWPRLLDTGTRWEVAAAFTLASLGLHVWLQYIQPAANVEGYDEVAEDAVLDAALPASATEVGAGHAAVDRVDDVVPEPVPTRPEVPAEPLEPMLYAAARAGRVERALELIEAGANPHALPPPTESDRRSLPTLAAVLPDLRLLRGLIACGVDLNVAHAGVTPLLAATRDSWHGRPDAVMTLLANGADSRASDGDGNTPLHHAARSSDPGVAALLRDAAAQIDVPNRHGLSPLGIACEAGNWRLARFLLERGAQTRPPGCRPVLLSAASGEDDDPAGVQLLLKLKADVGACDEAGRSALHEAALAGHLEIVEILLAAGGDASLADAQGRTPLHEAARGGHAGVLERLLAAPAHDAVAAAAAKLDHQGRNVLMLGCAATPAMPPPLALQLLALGVDAEQRDHDGKRAADRAAQAGRWSLVKVLDPGFATPDRRDDDEDAADAGDAADVDRPPAALLRDGLMQGRERSMEAIAQLLTPAELGALLHDDDWLPTPRQIEWLLAQGANLEVRDGAGLTPMTAWLRRGPSARQSIQALLDRAVPASGGDGLAGFLAACVDSEGPTCAHESFALQLLDRGADPFVASTLADPPLALAVRLDWSRLVARLLDIGVDLDARDSHGMSALHLAVALGREPLLKMLIVQGANPNLLAADGQTPLGVALSSGRRDLADWLDWRGWPLPKRALQAGDLSAATIADDADAVRRLLDLGLPVDAADDQGCSALVHAAGGGHRAVVDLLLQRGGDLQWTADSGTTPLSAAVSMGQVQIVDDLLQAGAPIEQRLPDGLTVLMVACALGLPDMAARLLAAGADVHAVDAQQRGALHFAAIFGFRARDRNRLLALLDTVLLADGDEVDLDRAAAGVAPVLLLLGARAEPGSSADEAVLVAGLELLLDHDVHLDVQDPRGFGPLHLAALHGLIDVARHLLRGGADPGVRDTLNRTASEIAVMRGFVDIAAELAPPPSPSPSPDAPMASYLRDPR